MLFVYSFAYVSQLVHIIYFIAFVVVVVVLQFL